MAETLVNNVGQAEEEAVEVHEEEVHNEVQSKAQMAFHRSHAHLAVLQNPSLLLGLPHNNP